MSSATRLGAMVMAAVMVLSVATPAVATEPADISVSVGNTSFTVEVTHNGTPVNDTAVDVTPTDSNATYGGDSGLTDANGTVTFDLPENETEVNISTTFNGTETTITEVLPAAGETEPTWDGHGPFGQWVISWLKNLLPPDSGDVLGQIVSDLVTKNNPGSDHRSAKANPGGNGPPDHAKNDKSDDAGTQDEAGNEGGPPDHAKNDKGNDGGNTTDTTSASTDDDEDGDGNSKGSNGNSGKAKDKDE